MPVREHPAASVGVRAAADGAVAGRGSSHGLRQGAVGALGI